MGSKLRALVILYGRVSLKNSLLGKEMCALTHSRCSWFHAELASCRPELVRSSLFSSVSFDS
jgi:hypothetical protein